MTRIHLNDYFSESVRKNWDRMALTDFDGASYQYKDVARKIAKLHLLFNHIGIAPGDKIALCGRNSAAWAVTFFAALSYGAVIVPILHEFKADTVHHLVNHSDARLFLSTAAFGTTSILNQCKLSQEFWLSTISHCYSHATISLTTHEAISTKCSAMPIPNDSLPTM